MWHDVIVYFLSVDICLLHRVANCLPHMLPITYFMCCRHSLLHCVNVIAYFILLPSLLTSSLQCRQHYIRCCLLLVLAYKRCQIVFTATPFYLPIYIPLYLHISYNHLALTSNNYKH